MGQIENAVLTYIHYRGFPGGSVIKNLPAMQEAREGDMDLIPESGGSPEEEMAAHSNIPACEIP